MAGATAATSIKAETNTTLSAFTMSSFSKCCFPRAKGSPCTGALPAGRIRTKGAPGGLDRRPECNARRPECNDRRSRPAAGMERAPPIGRALTRFGTEDELVSAFLQAGHLEDV